MSGWVREQCSKRSSTNWSEAVRRRRERRARQLQSSGSTEANQARWRDDPIQFARDVFSIEAWECTAEARRSGRSGQADILRSIATKNRVDARSGHKTGKSNSASIAAWWWVTTRPGGRVIITAPTFNQVKKVLWREIKRLGKIARDRGVIEAPDVPKDPTTGIEFDDGSEIIGISTNDADNLGGFSGAHLLFIIDEASGYPDEFFHALLGNTAGGEDDDPNAEAKILKLGNPTQTAGHFYDDFHDRREAVECLHISSEDTPNVVAGKVLVPGLATRRYVRDLLSECGGNEQHPLFQVRVRGNFPPQGARAVIPLVLVEEARGRWDETPAEGRLEIGLDVARHGDDDSVSVARRGRSLCKERDPKTGELLGLKVENGLDEEAVAGMVIAQIKALRRPGDEIPRVKVDCLGIGAAVASLLRNARDERDQPFCEVIEVRANEPGQEPERYPNIRSELWFATALWLKEGGSLPPDDTRAAKRLHAQLVAPEFEFDLRGRQVVEKKDKMKKRLGRSPDHADALALSIYCPPGGNQPVAHEPEDDHDDRWDGMGRGFG